MPNAPVDSTSTQQFRPVLTADRTYYVCKDGSDSNDGLADTAARACLTVMGALRKAALIDLFGFTAIIQIGDGIYHERIVVPKMTGQQITENLVLIGNLADPSAVTLFNDQAYLPVIEAIMGAAIKLGGGFTIGAPDGGYAINAAEAGVISVAGRVVFGPCGEYHAYANNAGTINFFEPYSIAGGAKAHWAASLAGQIYSTTTVSISEAVEFTSGFAMSFAGGSQQLYNNIFVIETDASVTGPRYRTEKNGVIETYGAGETYFPGSEPGSNNTGGQYG